MSKHMASYSHSNNDRENNSADSGYVKQSLANRSNGELEASPEPNIDSEEEETQREQFRSHRKASSRNEIRSIDLHRSSQHSFKQAPSHPAQIPPSYYGQHRNTSYIPKQGLPPVATNALPSNALVYTMPPEDRMLSADVKKERAAS
mmetsp:Transcript_26949/g.41070  ORF Transcript_26949/g.41070 Transcript_26949/m.41070 type:complete len:147 (+) Transcript_26949:743-1183(+)